MGRENLESNPTLNSCQWCMVGRYVVWLDNNVSVLFVRRGPRLACTRIRKVGSPNQKAGKPPPAVPAYYPEKALEAEALINLAKKASYGFQW